MLFPLPTIALVSCPDEAFVCADGLPGSWIIAESPSQYRPRHPERSAFHQLFETHFDSYVRAYEERFEPSSGPLRPVVMRSVEEFLSCGRLQGGFARIRCDKCRKQHLLAYSCRTRNFCSSCQAKRSVLFAEKLTGEILAPVPHRHWTFSIPRVLRGLFERERSLLSLLSQTAYASILKTFQALLGAKDGRPGCVLSLQTYGAYSNRGRIPMAARNGESANLSDERLPERDNSDRSREARSTWARLIKKIFEADPLLCTCGGRMRIVSFITDPRVVDRILRHCASVRCKTQDPFEPRPPALRRRFSQRRRRRSSSLRKCCPRR